MTEGVMDFAFFTVLPAQATCRTADLNIERMNLVQGRRHESAQTGV